MPICNVHLLSLQVPIPVFLSTLSTLPLTPLTISKVIRWIILPTTLSTDTLLARNIHWDILLILPSTSPLPSILSPQISSQWTIQAGVPSRLLQNFHTKNQRLLHPLPGDVPALTGAFETLPSPGLESAGGEARGGVGQKLAPSSQHLEISAPLQKWIHDFGSPAQPGAGAVSMLNLLSFKPGLKSEYLKYGAEFAKSVGSRRGGMAKIVGTVVPRGGGADGGDSGDGEEQWDEIALAHYPSIWHFADMLASEDYQVVNKRHRVGSLRDTFILCTSELALEDYVGGEGRRSGGIKL